MRHSLRHLLVLAILAMAGMVYTGVTASAQTCTIINGVKVLITPTTVIVTGCNGGYSFSWQNPIPPLGPINVPFTVDNININGTHPTFGAVSITKDFGRIASLSTLISNGSTRFPLTGTIRFYANATFSSQPGVTYTSATELVFVNNNLNQIFPFGNAQFALQYPVVFSAPGYPQKVLNPPSYITLP